MGRIDSPLLASGVRVLSGKLPMDAYPLTFRKDLLAHEAVSSLVLIELYLFPIERICIFHHSIELTTDGLVFEFLHRHTASLPFHSPSHFSISTNASKQ